MAPTGSGARDARAVGSRLHGGRRGHDDPGASMSDFDDTTSYDDTTTYDDGSSMDYATASEMSETMHETNMEIIDNMDGSDDYTYETTYEY
jgi:hypothetical protein